MRELCNVLIALLRAVHPKHHLSVPLVLALGRFEGAKIVANSQSHEY